MAPQRKILSFPQYFKLNFKTVIVITAVVFVSYKLIGYFFVGRTENPPLTNYLDKVKATWTSGLDRIDSIESIDSKIMINVSSSQNKSVKQDTDSVTEQLNALWNWTHLQHYPADTVFVLMPFVNAKKSVDLQTKFRTCVTSMSELSSAHIVLFVAGDAQSIPIALDIISGLKKKNVEAHQVDVKELSRLMGDTLTSIQQVYSHVSHSGTYYSHTVFSLSPGLHSVTPPSLTRLIMLDADLLFRADIRRLYALFQDFQPSNLMGLAYENQPVYRHVLGAYRRANPGTQAGNPPPHGYPGFNSGVLLMELGRMRASGRYNAALNSETVRAQGRKYSYQGHLGDQDFYSLLGLDSPDLFFRLPCGWNRQLCTWWREHGYREFFDPYFACPGPVSIYHGNCNTPFPQE